MNNKYKGFTMIEVLIAIVIMTVVLLSVFSIIKSTEVRTQASDYATDMTILAQNGIEIASDNLKNNWDAITPGDYKATFEDGSNTWTLSPGEEVGLESKFTRKIIIASICRDTHGEIIQSDPCSGAVDSNSKMIKVSVGWMNSKLGDPITAELLVIDYQ
jgi:prepilin-type N-terminal cleavage/methylation domain-containing protein